MQDHGTPGTPQFKIVHPNNEDKSRLQVNLNTGPVLEYFYTSLSTQDLI
jgi:hypothetical protein